MLWHPAAVRPRRLLGGLQFFYVERSTGELLLGPPKSRAGRRVVGIPDAIIPVLREHLSRHLRRRIPDCSAAVEVGQPGGREQPGSLHSTTRSVAELSSYLDQARRLRRRGPGVSARPPALGGPAWRTPGRTR